MRPDRAIALAGVREAIFSKCERFVNRGGTILRGQFGEGQVACPLTVFFEAPPWEVNHQFHGFDPRFTIGISRGFDAGMPFILSEYSQGNSFDADFVDGWQVGYELYTLCEGEGFFDVLAAERVGSESEPSVERSGPGDHREGEMHPQEGPSGALLHGGSGGEEGGQGRLPELRGSEGVGEAGLDCSPDGGQHYPAPGLIHELEWHLTSWEAGV